MTAFPQGTPGDVFLFPEDVSVQTLLGAMLTELQSLTSLQREALLELRRIRLGVAAITDLDLTTVDLEDCSDA